MATNSDQPTSSTPTLKSIIDELPLDGLKDEAKKGGQALTQWALSRATKGITDVSGKLDGIASGGPIGGALRGAVSDDAPAKGALKGGAKGALSAAKDKIASVFSSGGSGGDKAATKATNIIEEIDIGAPVDVVYNQWTQFQDFPDFMKKVEKVEQESDEKVTFGAQIVWSHRTWDATISEQIPDELIIWRSSGAKGHVDGAITFHELAPRLTRVIVVLEYYPQGLFERTGNIWRAQGRRARLELKHFRRHVMMNVLTDPDQVEGWRGEIHDREVVAEHGEVDTEDEYDDEEPADEAEDEEYDDEPVDEADEEYDEEPVDEDEEAVDEDEEAVDEDEEPVDEDEGAEEPPRRRRRTR